MNIKNDYFVYIIHRCQTLKNYQNIMVETG